MKTDLDKKIRAFEKERKEDKSTMFSKSGASAGRVGSEFLIATLVFAGIGFAIDTQLETTPWITLVLFFVGFITGVYNAWRVMNVDTEQVGLKYKAPPISEIGSHDIAVPGAKKADEEVGPHH